MNTIRKRLRISMVIPVLLMTGCAMKPPVPDNIEDTFILERDLVGQTMATGSFSAIDGTYRQFITAIDGTWDGHALTLVEDFEYDDGEQERKTWILTKLANGEWSGVREDVIGTARGYQDGKVFRMEYDMVLTDEDGKPGRKMRFRDVLARNSQGTIINNATVGMWGFKVASVNLFIDRVEPATPQ